MNTLEFKKTEDQIDKIWNDAAPIVKLIVDRVYPIILTGLEEYRHYCWRLDMLKQIKEDAIPVGLCSPWAQELIAAISDLDNTGIDGLEPGDVYTLVLRHLNNLTRDEVLVKIKAINQG